VDREIFENIANLQKGTGYNAVNGIPIERLREVAGMLGITPTIYIFPAVKTGFGLAYYGVEGPVIEIVPFVKAEHIQNEFMAITDDGVFCISPKKVYFRII
jgi:hypothetical protein